MIWIVFILYIIGSVIIRNVLLTLITTKKEKAILNAIKSLKYEQKINPSKKTELGTQIYTLRFSSWKFGLKSVFVKFGSILLLSSLCVTLFSEHIKFAILYYIVGIIILGIVYRRLIK